jgi:alpha-galactosidase
MFQQHSVRQREAYLRMSISRRSFLAATGAAPLAMPLARSPAGGGAYAHHDGMVDVVRPPDSMMARSADGSLAPLIKKGGAWQAEGLMVHADLEQNANRVRLPIVVESTRSDLTYLKLRWRWQIEHDPAILSDAWERGYGDLQWQGLVPERVLPWYFYLIHGGHLTNFGVETQPNAFCFWQCDADGVSLWIDLRNGGEPALLAGRRLVACTIVMVDGAVAQPIETQLRAFCARLCPTPRLPRGPIVGSNDWNYAYGKNTAAGILRDAKLMVDLAPAGYRPFVVIDDGWQDVQRFPDLTGLAAQIRAVGARPGIWIRPVRAAVGSTATRLPDQRFGNKTQERVSAYDPSVKDGLSAAVQSVRHARRQGYEFIKHDFTTYDLLGQWGREMGPQPALPGWHFADRSRTTAEIILGLYRALRSEAGTNSIMLGCNTFGHLGAGIFESQRIGDDTSGQDWERTRRYGVNSLSFRIAQHRTFFHVDPDIVAVTQKVPWEMTRQWMDVVARSGTTLFIAPQPEAMTQEARNAIQAAMTIAVRATSGCPVDSMSSTTPQIWAFAGPDRTRQHYEWCGLNGADPFS